MFFNTTLSLSTWLHNLFHLEHRGYEASYVKLEVTMGSNILTRVRASNLVGYLLVFFAVCALKGYFYYVIGLGHKSKCICSLGATRATGGEQGCPSWVMGGMGGAVAGVGRRREGLGRVCTVKTHLVSRTNRTFWHLCSGPHGRLEA